MREMPSPSHRFAMGPSLSRFAGEGLITSAGERVGVRGEANEFV